MKPQTHRILAAASAMALMLSAAAVSPAVYAAAPCYAAAQDAKKPNTIKVSIETEMPDEAYATLLRQETFVSDGKAKAASFPLTQIPEDKFTCYYIYVPKQENLDALELRIVLEREDETAGKYDWLKCSLDLKPGLDDCIVKLDGGGDQALRMEMTKLILTAADGAKDVPCNVYVYAYNGHDDPAAAQPKEPDEPKEPEEPDKPEKPVMLPAAALPKDAAAISEVVRLEDASKETTLSFANYDYGFLEPQYEADFGNYPAKAKDSELWYEFLSRTEIIFLHKNTVTIPAEDGGAPTVSVMTDNDILGYALPLQNGRYAKLIEPRDGKKPWECECMQVRTAFEGREYTKENPNGKDVDMPEGRGTLNISGLKPLGTPYSQYYVDLRHATDNAYDNANYAELTFHVYEQTGGKWSESRTFTAGAALELPAGGSDYTSDGCAEIPADLMHADESDLYIISPRFYNIDENGKQTEITGGTGYATLCGFNKSQPAERLMGDINCDKEIDVSDAVILARFCAEDAAIKITDEGRKAMDVNGDSEINSDDIIAILRIIAKLPAETEK